MCLTSHGQPAGHADHLTGDERRVVGGKEQYGTDDIFRLTESAKRNGSRERGAQLVTRFALPGKVTK